MDGLIRIDFKAITSQYLFVGSGEPGLLCNVRRWDVQRPPAVEYDWDALQSWRDRVWAARTANVFHKQNRGWSCWFLIKHSASVFTEYLLRRQGWIPQIAVKWVLCASMRIVVAYYSMFGEPVVPNDSNFALFFMCSAFKKQDNLSNHEITC